MVMRSFASFFEGRALRIATAFAVQIAGVGLSFLFSVLLARLIGVAGVGLYFLAITVVDIGATISRLGLENAGLRFASIAYSQGDRGTLAALYRRSMGLAFGAGIVVALPVWLIVSHLPLGGDRAPELRAEFPLLVFALAPLALLIIQAEFLKGVGASSIGTFAHAVVPPLLLLTGSIALWLLNAATLHSIFLTYVIVALVSMIHAVAVWNWRLPGIWRERGAFDTRRLLRTSMPVLLVTSMNLVMGWTDILVLGIWADAKEVGIYGISMRIALLTAFVLGAINVVVAPQFAALHAEGNVTALRRLAQQSAFWTSVAAAPALLALMLVPDLILQLFGPQFKEGAWALRILALGQFVNLATGPVGTLLLMTGHEKLMRNNVAASAALNLLGNLILVPSYGAVGAAASTALSLSFMNIVSWITVRKKLHINMLDYAALRTPPCVNR
jgi:O-antigen/teichoic acid export membrane protein